MSVVESGAFDVASAEYGVRGRATRDVTETVKRLVTINASGQNLTLTTDVDVHALFGDPAPGLRKTLFVRVVFANSVQKTFALDEEGRRFRKSIAIRGSEPDANATHEMSAWLKTSPLALKKTVVQIYQTSSTRVARHSYHGFGDYLKGVLYLHQLSRAYPFDLFVDATHHPISRYIRTQACPPTPGHDDGAESEAKTARDGGDCYSSEYSVPITKPQLTKVLQDCPPNRRCLLMTNIGPDLPLDDETRDFAKAQCLALLPGTALAASLQPYAALKPYAVIHVRAGDDVLLYKDDSDWLLQNVLDVLPTDFPHKHVVLMSDCFGMLSNLQMCLELRHPGVRFHLTGARAIHLGMPSASDEDVQHTLLDFFILAGTAAIYQVSPYFWGSGFSSWCSHIYNIPLHPFVLRGRKRSAEITRYHASSLPKPNMSLKNKPIGRILEAKGSEDALFDVVIPVKPKHYRYLGTCLDGVLQHVAGWGTIHIVSSLPESLQSAIAAKVDRKRLNWVSESAFPFQRVDVATYTSSGVADPARYYHQLLKMYAPLVVPGIRARVLTLDADLVWLGPVAFADRETVFASVDASLACRQSHVDWMRSLLPCLEMKSLGEGGGGASKNHATFEVAVLQQLMSDVVFLDDCERKRAHTSDYPVVYSKFWRIYLNNIVSGYPYGASECELYYHYARVACPNRIGGRVLKGEETLNRGAESFACARGFGFAYVCSPDYLHLHEPHQIARVGEMLSATYGEADSSAAMDVTETLRRMLRKGSHYLAIDDRHATPMDVSLGRDPAPGRPKFLKISFIDAQTRRQSQVSLREYDLKWKDWAHIHQYVSFDAQMPQSSRLSRMLVGPETSGVLNAEPTGAVRQAETKGASKDSVTRSVDGGGITLQSMPQLALFEATSKDATFFLSAVARVFYGQDLKMLDVTLKALAALPPATDLTCSRIINALVENPNVLFGDPLPGTAKKLIFAVDGSLPSTSVTFTFHEMCSKLQFPIHVVRHAHSTASHDAILNCNCPRQ